MRRSAQFDAEKQDAKLDNEAQEEPMTKKSRSENRISKIATLDSDTMVETFKFLSYCQLAKNSLVSNRFWNLIQSHRHKLALLCVESIIMKTYNNRPEICQIFNKKLSAETYNEWIVCNRYSNQIPLEGKAAGGYELSAYGNYKVPNRKRTSVFFARIKNLNNEAVPLVEHFIRLLTDPFIHIRYLVLIPQSDVFNLLSAAIYPGRGRLQCEKLDFNFNANEENFINWIKKNVICDELQITGCHAPWSCDKRLLKFFATGSSCTTKIGFIYRQLSKAVVIDLVQKFMGLKSCDESQIVHSIRGFVSKPVADALKSNYEKFFVKEEKDKYGHTTAHVFEFVNADIGKKYQLNVTCRTTRGDFITLKILNL
ncbi:hypothetical protein Ddc_13806 [Ditylenchus destructor]|nr:hypothetical protein Ddc_13806 [Ditylenchus destructor]